MGCSIVFFLEYENIVRQDIGKSCLLCYGGVGTVDVIIIVSMIKLMLILGCAVHDDLIDGAFAMHGMKYNG